MRPNLISDNKAGDWAIKINVVKVLNLAAIPPSAHSMAVKGQFVRVNLNSLRATSLAESTLNFVKVLGGAIEALARVISWIIVESSEIAMLWWIIEGQCKHCPWHVDEDEQMMRSDLLDKIYFGRIDGAQSLIGCSNSIAAVL